MECTKYLKGRIPSKSLVCTCIVFYSFFKLFTSRLIIHSTSSLERLGSLVENELVLETHISKQNKIVSWYIAVSARHVHYVSQCSGFKSSFWQYISVYDFPNYSWSLNTRSLLMQHFVAWKYLILLCYPILMRDF